MGFVNEKRDIRDEFPEWEYLNALGVRDFLGRPIKKFTLGLIVDRQRNYYLIPRGSTNPNRDDIDIYFFALCLDGKVVNMEVKRCAKESARKKWLECHWKIEKIIFPENWSFDEIGKDEFEKIVTEAFTVYYCSTVVVKEWIKEITVEFVVPVK